MVVATEAMVEVMEVVMADMAEDLADSAELGLFQLPRYPSNQQLLFNKDLIALLIWLIYI
jgi:hypothetical protein